VASHEEFQNGNDFNRNMHHHY